MENNMKEWTTLRILSWITLFVFIIGKNSIMEEIRESKTISNNTNGQRVHEYIKYERDELIGIAHKCKQDN